MYFYRIKDIHLKNDDIDKHLLVDHSLTFFLDSSKGFLLLILFITRFYVSGARDARVSEPYIGAFKFLPCRVELFIKW